MQTILPSPVAVSLEQGEDIEAAFAHGDYVTAFLHGEETDWRKHAAQALLGMAHEAIPKLRVTGEANQTFYLGVAYWLNGQDKEAIQTLKSVSIAHAQNLIRLIQKDKISVLGQFSRAWKNCDPKFKVSTIGYAESNLPMKPGASIHDFYDQSDPPDFYTCSVIEGRDIPADIQEFPNPIIGTTSDYDLMIHNTHAWLQVFDDVIVAGPEEHSQLTLLSQSPVSTFPKLYGIASTLPPLPRLFNGTPVSRDIDLFFSGTTLHPYQPEKADLINSLLSVKGTHCKFINGFVPTSDYLALLSRSKTCFTYIRRADEMPTRALEALSMGCIPLIQEGSSLSLYLNENDCVFTYGQTVSLPELLDQVLKNWLSIYSRMPSASQKIREQFAESRVFSQYLRYATFLAARPHSPRQPAHVLRSGQKEDFLFRGQMSGPALRNYRLKTNCSGWLTQYKNDRLPQHLINATREIILAVAAEEYPPARRMQREATHDPSLMRQACALYHRGMADHPDNLILRFNYVRAALHFGQEKEVGQALVLAESLVNESGNWNIDPKQDVFPWDFFSQMFNYRDYLDTCTNALMTRTDVSPALTSYIMASLNFYLANVLQRQSYFLRSMALDPNFGFYTFKYCEGLLRENFKGNAPRVGPLLEQLAAKGPFFLEALQLLRTLCTTKAYASEVAFVLIQKLEVLESSFVSTPPAEDWRYLHLKPLPLSHIVLFYPE